jgi:exosortase A-associated hydrolase 2
VRTPAVIKGHVLFLQGLFEELNINRHAFTKASLLFADNQFTTTLFDYIGTGDSQGELQDVELSQWSQDIMSQVSLLRNQDDKPITLIGFGSAALLLDDEIMSSVDDIQLWHPEVTGSRFIKQMERLALLNITHNDVTTASEYKEVAGYKVKNELWSAIKAVEYKPLPLKKSKITWFECVDSKALALPKVRDRQQKQWVNRERFFLIEEQKYWQSTMLVVPHHLIAHSLKVLLGCIVND